MGSFSKTAKPSLELVTPSVAVIKDSGKNQLKRGSGDRGIIWLTVVECYSPAPCQERHSKREQRRDVRRGSWLTTLCSHSGSREQLIHVPSSFLLFIQFRTRTTRPRNGPPHI